MAPAPTNNNPAGSGDLVVGKPIIKFRRKTVSFAFAADEPSHEEETIASKQTDRPPSSERKPGEKDGAIDNATIVPPTPNNKAANDDNDADLLDDQPNDDDDAGLPPIASSSASAREEEEAEEADPTMRLYRSSDSDVDRPNAESRIDGAEGDSLPSQEEDEEILSDYNNDDNASVPSIQGDGKERRRSDGTSSEIGAVQVDECAPQLNRRFFRGLGRASVRARRGEARAARRRRRRAAGITAEETSEPEEKEEEGNDEGQRERSQNERGEHLNTFGRMVSTIVAHVSFGYETNDADGGENDDEEAQQRTTSRRGLISRMSQYMVTATLVESFAEEGEVVVAERVGFYESHSKVIVIGLSMCLLLATMAAVVSAVVATRDNAPPMPGTDEPSMRPSAPPTLDSRPTLEILQERGNIRCGRGLWSKSESGEGDLYIDLCRAIAAVVLGDPESIEEVIVTGSDRFEKLHDGAVDLLLYGDTHTIEREVREKTTGSGFTFSSPYYYDGLAYYGEPLFVECAENRTRFDDCSSLRICTYTGSTGHSFLQSSFPSDFIVVGPSLMGAVEMMRAGRCNVMAANKLSLLLNIAANDASDGGNHTVSDILMTKEPYAAVTRNDDREFSDVVNWVVQALFYGEEQGLEKDTSSCQPRTVSAGSVLDLDFLRAVSCVGNYVEISHGVGDNRGPNQINDGTTGMHYATPFGELEPENDVGDASLEETILDEIRTNGTLNCGVIVPDGYDGMDDLTMGKGLVGMSVDYCKTVASALFNGNSNSVNLLRFSAGDDGSFLALDNGTIDVLSGSRIEKGHDFGNPGSLGGLHFSSPYYYGTEAGDAVSFSSLATRDGDVQLSSFVNLVVVATFYAQEKNILKKNSLDMPLISLFGNMFAWALRDAVNYSGSYYQLYEKNFGEGAADEGMGRNALNMDGSPQIRSYPGLGR